MYEYKVVRVNVKYQEAIDKKLNREMALKHKRRSKVVKRKCKGRKAFGHYEYRKLCFSKYPKDVCANCGYEGKVYVHHIDKNWRNNVLSNLIPLCGECHRLAHSGDEYVRIIGRGVSK